MWVAQSGWCERCRQPNLTVANITVVADGDRNVGICPSCAGLTPRSQPARTAGAEDYNVARGKQPEPEAPRGSKYAGRFPGGKALHDESGKLNWQWEKVGTELVGEFLSMKPYENGHIAKVRGAEDGIVRAFSAPAILSSVLENVEPGTQIAIVFSGEKPAKKRGMNPVKLFEVYELEEEE